MKGLMLTLVLLFSGVAKADEVTRAKLFFSVPEKAIIQYALANMRLSSRYQKYPKDFDEQLDFNQIHLASLVDSRKRTYVFVGIPSKQPLNGGYVAYIQYCDYSEQYIFASNVLSSVDIETLFKNAIAANGKVFGEAPDVCALQDPAR